MIIRMKKQIVTVSLSLVFVAWLCFSSAFAQDKTEKKEDYPAVIKANCLKCHDVNRVCSEIGKEDKDGWKKIVERMVQKGAALNEARQKGMIEYLGGLKDPKALCQ